MLWPSGTAGAGVARRAGVRAPLGWLVSRHEGKED